MRPEKQIQRAALTLTRWVGSPASIIIHTAIFIGCFVAARKGFIEFEEMLLILTTIVSLEAIYLSIFIQMTINYTTEAVEDISEDVEEMQVDVAEIQENVDELQENVEDISEGVEEISEDEKAEEVAELLRKLEQKNTLSTIQTDLKKLIDDITKLQQPKQ